ncbi:hypothetical protein E8P77_11765 [Soehngenia saccharolytica]|nr:hypothetical protein E8P77_11765 [Soehngenia saccharolytica]
MNRILVIYWFEYYPKEDIYHCFERKDLKYKKATRQGYVKYESDKKLVKHVQDEKSVFMIVVQQGKFRKTRQE